MRPPAPAAAPRRRASPFDEYVSPVPEPRLASDPEGHSVTRAHHDHEAVIAPDAARTNKRPADELVVADRGDVNVAVDADDRDSEGDAIAGVGKPEGCPRSLRLRVPGRGRPLLPVRVRAVRHPVGLGSILPPPPQGGNRRDPGRQRGREARRESNDSPPGGLSEIDGHVGIHGRDRTGIAAVAMLRRARHAERVVSGVAVSFVVVTSLLFGFSLLLSLRIRAMERDVRLQWILVRAGEMRVDRLARPIGARLVDVDITHPRSSSTPRARPGRPRPRGSLRPRH